MARVKLQFNLIIIFPYKLVTYDICQHKTYKQVRNDNEWQWEACLYLYTSLHLLYKAAVFFVCLSIPPLFRHDRRTATKFGTHIRVDILS